MNEDMEFVAVHHLGVLERIPICCAIKRNEENVR